LGVIRVLIVQFRQVSFGFGELLYLLLGIASQGVEPGHLPMDFGNPNQTFAILEVYFADVTIDVDRANTDTITEIVDLVYLVKLVGTGVESDMSTAKG
jgi:hypothetical protein